MERDPLNQELDNLRVENERLRTSRDEWKARAFALFWMLPDDTPLGVIQDYVSRARDFWNLDRRR